MRLSPPQITDTPFLPCSLRVQRHAFVPISSYKLRVSVRSDSQARPTDQLLASVCVCVCVCMWSSYLSKSGFVSVLFHAFRNDQSCLYCRISPPHLQVLSHGQFAFLHTTFPQPHHHHHHQIFIRHYLTPTCIRPDSIMTRFVLVSTFMSEIGKFLKVIKTDFSYVCVCTHDPHTLFFFISRTPN